MARLVTVDALGTLIRLRAGVASLYVNAFHQYYNGATLAESEATLDTRFRTAYKAALSRKSLPALSPEAAYTTWCSIVAATLGLDFSEHRGFLDFVVRDYFVQNHGLWQVYPEAERVLSRLQQEGCRVVVVSNMDSRLRNILQSHGELLSDPTLLTSLEVITSCDVVRPKPDAEGLLRAQKLWVKSLGDCDPSKRPWCLHIGDSEEDRECALRASFNFLHCSAAVGVRDADVAAELLRMESKG